MQVRHLLAAGLLGLGLVAAPLIPTARAADDPPPAKPADPGAGGRGQRGGGQRGNPAQMVDRYHDSVYKLTLTDDQKTKLDPAFKDAKEKVDAAVKDAGEDRQKVFAAIKPIMDDLRKKVDDTLTQEQKDQLAKERAARGGPNGGGRRPGGAGGNPPPGDKPAEPAK